MQGCGDAGMLGRLASSCKEKGREEKGWEKCREGKGPSGEGCRGLAMGSQAPLRLKR